MYDASSDNRKSMTFATSAGSLWAKCPFDKLMAMPDRLSDVAAEHEAILAAARAGDTRAALKAMQFHIENGWREFKRNFPLYDQTVMP